MQGSNKVKVAVGFLSAFLFFIIPSIGYSQCDADCSGRGSGAIEWIKPGNADKRQAKFIVANLCSSSKKITAEYQGADGLWYTLGTSLVREGAQFSGIGYNAPQGKINWRWKIYGPNCSYSNRPSWENE